MILASMNRAVEKLSVGRSEERPSSTISTEKPVIAGDDLVEGLPMAVVGTHFQWKNPHLRHPR